MQKYTGNLVDAYGRVIALATVTVYRYGTTTLATLYSDNGSTTKTNPFTTDSTTGFYGFYAANGRYTIVFAKTDFSFTATDTQDILLFDPVDFGANNLELGTSALAANTTGLYNTAVGWHGLTANTTGARNTALGYSSLISNTTGTDNVAIGVNVLRLSVTNTSNVGVGHNALSVATAEANTAVGDQVLAANTTGFENAGFGAQALLFNTTGQLNTALGAEALQHNTTGSNNVAVGYDALWTLTTGSRNVAVGSAALSSATTPSNNVAVGIEALTSTTTGANNVAIGDAAGYTSTPANANTTGQQNVWIGADSGPGSATQFSNSVAIGYQARTTASNQVVIGNSSTTSNVLFGGLTLQGTSSNAAQLQTFVLRITNDAGTLKHYIGATTDPTVAQDTAFVNKITGATNVATTTPSIDATTNFAGGGGIDAGTTSRFFFNTVTAQADGQTQALSVATGMNTTGTVLTVQPLTASFNVNGTTRRWFGIRLYNAATGAAFAITPANIGAGTFLDVVLTALVK